VNYRVIWEAARELEAHAARLERGAEAAPLDWLRRRQLAEAEEVRRLAQALRRL